MFDPVSCFANLVLIFTVIDSVIISHLLTDRFLLLFNLFLFLIVLRQVDLSIDINPTSVRQTVHKKEYLRALLMAFKLNEKQLTTEVSLMYIFSTLARCASLDNLTCCCIMKEGEEKKREKRN